MPIFPAGSEAGPSLSAHMVDGLVNQRLLSLGPEITEKPDNRGYTAFCSRVHTRQTATSYLGKKLKCLFWTSTKVSMALQNSCVNPAFSSKCHFGGTCKQRIMYGKNDFFKISLVFPY